MKKLYRSKGAVHPSPPLISDHLSFLPATILSLAAALSLQDREVLAYLISCSNTTNNLTASPSSRKSTSTSTVNNNRKSTSGDHPARFNCSCFGCYTSYWVRWDESPNRELIHEIIDAFEFGLLSSQMSKPAKIAKKDKRSNNKKRGNKAINVEGSELNQTKNKDHRHHNQMVKTKLAEDVSNSTNESGEVDGEVESKGSVRRFVSFVGEKIWGSLWS